MQLLNFKKEIENLVENREGKNMDIKRTASALIGFPIVATILIFCNKYVVDITICLIAMICLYEYFHCFRGEKQTKKLSYITYISALSIALLHIIPKEFMIQILTAIIPVDVLVLFAFVVVTDMKYTIKDISITLFGICYIVIFLMFIPILRECENGRILIWYAFITAWGTDIFAYLIGKKFGKHKFSKVSPNKSIEGCIAGTIGAVVLALIYTVVCNKYLGMNFNYLYIILISIILSLVGQLGDFSASSIKRYAGIKDFGNLIPGHGGMLDRIDSVIFIAPFAYFLLMLL